MQTRQHRVNLAGGCHEPVVAKGKWGFRGLWVLYLHGYFYIETFPGSDQQSCIGPWGQGAGMAAGLCFPFWENITTSVFLERSQQGDNQPNR